MPIFECSRCNEMTYSAYSGVPHACAACGNGTMRVIDGAFDEARAASRDLAAGDHAFLVYEGAGAGEVAEFCARFIGEGIAAAERVVAALPGELDGNVRALLTDEVSGAVDWHDAADIYGDFDPDRVAETYESLIEAEERPVRLIAGPPGVETMTPEELDRYERLAHAIVNDRGAVALCLFDTTVIPPEFIEIASRRHGLTVTDGTVRRNERFEYAPV
jgi:hypothetical protein